MHKSPGDDSTERLLIDVSDLLIYLHRHTVVSGIQRVIVEVASHLESHADIGYIAFRPADNAFVCLDPTEVRALLGAVQTAGEVNKEQILRAVKGIADGVDSRPRHHAKRGDVVAILGAGWAHPGLFAAVYELKRQGAAVVVLVYDLIPVVVPGFWEEMVHQFRSYLPRVAFLADRAPAISEASRRDLERYCEARGWPVPPGSVTGLAANQWTPERLLSLGTSVDRAWHRPFVLMVGTIESRKNHILALRCWQRLIAARGPDRVPDLICVGRVGWNVFEFLEEFEVTEGLGGRVHLLTESLSDQRLAALYRDCEFTVYPSRYEGWGLPVSESLEAGKPVVAARDSSIPEAGRDLATYFEDNNLDEFFRAVDRYVGDPAALSADARRIRENYSAPSWESVAAVLQEEFESAREVQRPFVNVLELGREYPMKPSTAYTGGLEGEAFLRFLDHERRLPLTGQVPGVEAFLTAELAVMRVGDPVVGGTRVSAVRPMDGPLVLVVACSEESVAGEVFVTVDGARPDKAYRLPGEPLVVDIGDGTAGQVFSVAFEAASWGGAPLDLRSMLLVQEPGEVERVITRYLAGRARLAVEQAELERSLMAREQATRQALDAVRETLEDVTSSPSWRLTQPLRSAKRFARKGRTAGKRPATD